MTEDTTTGPKALQSSQSAFVQHLATYPAVSAVAGLVASFPVVKIFVSNAVPLLHAIHDRTRPVADPVLKTVEPAFKRADQIGDKVLSEIDTRFPQLKTVQPADLVEEAQSRLNSYRESAQNTVDSRLVQPVASAAAAAKQQYIKVYDSNGRHLTTIVNNGIGPINDRIENAIGEYLPGSTDLPAKDGSQLQRTSSLIRSAAERAKPQIDELQQSTRQHVADVYSNKLKEKSGDTKPSLYSSLLALASTGRQLTGEGLSKCAHLAGLVKTDAEKKLGDVAEVAGEKLNVAGEKIAATAAAASEQVQAKAKPAVAQAKAAAEQAQASAHETAEAASKKAEALAPAPVY